MFKTGFILSARADLLWFLGLPFLAVAVALTSQHYLSAVAMASVSLWITMPHQGATWLRTYGLTEDWQRFRGRLIVAPILLFATAVVGLQWAPITLMIIVMLWDHQHSIMQQHGFARIYDFKAGTYFERAMQSGIRTNRKLLRYYAETLVRLQADSEEIASAVDHWIHNCPSEKPAAYQLLARTASEQKAAEFYEQARQREAEGH